MQTDETPMGGSGDLPEPTFLEQAYAAIEESYAAQIADPQFGHGIKARDHQLMVKLMFLHEQHIYTLLLEKFSDSVAEHYKPVIRLLTQLEKGQKAIMDKQLADEKKIADHERRLNDKRARLEKLENEIAFLNPEALADIKEKMEVATPLLEKALEGIDWWRDTIKWWKIVGYILAITGLWFLAHMIWLT